MNQAPSQFLRQYLIDCGDAVAPEAIGPTLWPIVSAMMPDDGARYIAVTDLIARQDPKAMNVVLRSEHPILQFLLRAEDYDVGIEKGIALQHRFDRIGNQNTASGGLGWIPVTYNNERIVLTAVHVQVPIMAIAQEKNRRRWLFSFHVQMEYRD